MDVKKSELIKIIQEETIRIKKVKFLYEQKEAVLKQLNEICGEENIEEAAGLSSVEQGLDAVKYFGSRGPDAKMPSGLQNYLSKAIQIYSFIWGKRKGTSSIDPKILEKDFSIITLPLTLYRGKLYGSSSTVAGGGGSGYSTKDEQFKLLQTNPERVFPKEASEFERILKTDYAAQQPTIPSEQKQI